jgi:hypothetical protein
MLGYVRFESEEGRTVDKKNLPSITINDVKIEIDIVQQSWWARTSRNIILSILALNEGKLA